MSYHWLLKHIDSKNTPFTFQQLSQNCGVLTEYKAFFNELGLITVDDFFSLRGQIVDKNRRSEVHKIILGNPPKTFYLKLHHNFVKRPKRNPLRKEPMILRELRNMMHYARAGFCELKPAAWGWKKTKKGGRSFLITPELRNYYSLHELLNDPKKNEKNRYKLKDMIWATAMMLRKMHDAGITHIDLFSWHIYLKFEDGNISIQPLDLERTRLCGHTPIIAKKIFKRHIIDDLAALNLTVNWPEITIKDRMTFLKIYLNESSTDRIPRKLIHDIIKRSKHRGIKPKFQQFNVIKELKK